MVFRALVSNRNQKKTKAKINKSVYLGLSILEFIKTLMYGLYQNNAKLCYVDTDSLVFDIKTEDFYKDIADDVEKWFHTSNYEVNRPLPTERNKKVIGLMKDELGGKIMTEFAAVRPKTYFYLMYDGKKKKRKKKLKKQKSDIKQWNFCLNFFA